jgi:spermidine/putrescine transport system ATP-binding protein
MTDEHEVELIEVTKRFGSTTAVESVSLSVERGEFLTLLGPSGCGKTTLLRIIAGLEAPDEGRVLLGGCDVSQLPPYRRDVTTVFQHYALFPHLDVFGNVAFGLERRQLPRDQIRRRVAEALEMVRLSGLERRKVSELSGGQQQRVALARAIILRPRVLLLDEPLAALDLKLRKQMQVEIKNLQRQLGISFIYVTHDQQEALTMSDRVAVMNAGRIEQIGSAIDIYERPRTAFVADFIGLSNILEGTVECLRDRALVISIGNAKVEAQAPAAGETNRLGQRVRIMVRPEKILLLPAESTSQLCGRIESAIYLGDSTQLCIRLENNQQLTVVEQNRNPRSSAQCRIGQVVAIRWEPESAVVLGSV